MKGIGYACDWELGSLSGGPSPGLLSGPVRTLRPGCWRLVCALGVDTQEVISIFNVVGAHHRSDQRHQIVTPRPERVSARGESRVIVSDAM